MTLWMPAAPQFQGRPPVHTRNRNATSRRLIVWIVACGIAELGGLTLAALWWLIADRVDPEPVTTSARLGMLGLKGAAGLVEGLFLGLAQALALRPIYPRLPIRNWVLATTLLAVAGWTIGSSFAMFASPGPAPGAAPFDPTPGETAMLAAAFGLAVGALFGVAQALVLRRAARRAWLWVAGNMAGWAIALPGIYLAASAGPENPAQAAANALAAGAVAGLLLGAVTSLAIRRMPPRP